MSPAGRSASGCPQGVPAESRTRFVPVVCDDIMCGNAFIPFLRSTGIRWCAPTAVRVSDLAPPIDAAATDGYALVRQDSRPGRKTVRYYVARVRASASAATVAERLQDPGLSRLNPRLLQGG